MRYKSGKVTQAVVHRLPRGTGASIPGYIMHYVVRLSWKLSAFFFSIKRISSFCSEILKEKAQCLFYEALLVKKTKIRMHGVVLLKRTTSTKPNILTVVCQVVNVKCSIELHYPQQTQEGVWRTQSILELHLCASENLYGVIHNISSNTYPSQEDTHYGNIIQAFISYLLQLVEEKEREEGCLLTPSRYYVLQKRKIRP